MNIFSKAVNFFGRVKNWLFSIGDDTIVFAKGILIILSQNKELQAIASNAVKLVEEAAMSYMSGNKLDSKAKLEMAQDIVKGGLKSKGLPIVMNAINIAIEAAVANMNVGK